MFMRLCSICATLAFLLGVLGVLYIWPVFQRGLRSGYSPRYDAGYTGYGGYRGYGGNGGSGGYRGNGGYDRYGGDGGYGGYGGYGRDGGDGGYGGLAGMVEAHLTGHGVRADVCGLCPLSTSSAGSASPLLLTLLLKSSPPAEIDETIGPRSGQKRSRVSLKTRQSPMHARYSDQAPDFFPAKTAPPPLFSPAMLPFPHALSVQHV